MIDRLGVDVVPVQPEKLRDMVESGHYKPEPALVAQAMLKHRGLRALLGTGGEVSPADRTRPAPAPRPQAA